MWLVRNSDGHFLATTRNHGATTGWTSDPELARWFKRRSDASQCIIKNKMKGFAAACRLQLKPKLADSLEVIRRNDQPESKLHFGVHEITCAIAQQAALDRRELWIFWGSYLNEHIDTLVSYFRAEGLKVTVYKREDSEQVPWDVRDIALGNLQQPFPVLHFQW